MTDNLRGLIERLEKLEGSDRELDAEIDVALFGGETVWKMANYTMESYPASRRPSATHIGGFANEHVPSYTASLDAAVALVERVLPGWEWQVGDDAVYGRFGAVYQSSTAGGAGYSEEDMIPGATPAIALLIATLLALQGEQQ